MPYLQLDPPNRYPAEVKRRLARQLGDLYAEIMQTTPDMVSVAVRDPGEGSVWRCGPAEPEPAAVLMCDVRRGRPADRRARLAQALVGACVAALGLPANRLAVYFSQHAADDIFRDGRFAVEWSPEEGGSS